MTPPPTDEFENLRLLREAATPIRWKTFRDGGSLVPDTAFYRAAHAALGPEGCVTRELELLEAARDSFKKDFGDAMDWMREARAERDALKDEVKRLKVELEHAKTCAANYDGIAHRLRVERDALREEVERLREACSGGQIGIDYGGDVYPEDEAFFRAAWSALGPEGHVMQELDQAKQLLIQMTYERDELKDDLEMVRQDVVGYRAQILEVRRTNTIVLSENKMLKQRCEGLENTRAERDELRLEVERQRWVFAELDSLKNELAKLKP